MNKKLSSAYHINVAGVSTAEFFWGLALPLLFESTFLQLYLKSIGASNRTIGLVPALMSAGMMLFGVAAAYITSHLEEKRMAVIITHATASLPVIIFGALLPFTPAGMKVSLFLTCYIAFSVLLGFTLPVWQNFLVKIFDTEKIVRALAVMMIVQMAARFTGSVIIFRVVEKFDFTAKITSALFVTAGLLMFAGSFMFYFVKEGIISTESLRPPHNVKSLVRSARNIIRNRNYMLFMYSFIESHATIAVLSFYANFAVQHRGINRASAAGLFAASIYIASFTSNVIFGLINLLSLKRKIIFARISGICGTVLLIFSSGIYMFIATSFLFGISRGINQFAYAPGVKLISGEEDVTDFFAISSVLIFPFAFGIPFLSGLALDISGGGEEAFIFLFAILLIVQAAGLVAVILSDFRAKV